MSDRNAPPSINMSAIQVAGVGGLGMMAMVGVIAAAIPIARVLLVSGLLGGGLVALALILARRRVSSETPRSDLPLGLDLARTQDRHDPDDTLWLGNGLIPETRTV